MAGIRNKDYKVGDKVITRLKGITRCPICEILYPDQMQEEDLLKATIVKVFSEKEGGFKGTTYKLANKTIARKGTNWKWCNHVLIPACNIEVKDKTDV